MSLGVSRSGIPFGGRRGLTYVFFLICSTDDRGHLHTLARLTRLFQDDFVLRLRELDSADEAKSIFDQAEADLEDRA